MPIVILSLIEVQQHKQSNNLAIQQFSNPTILKNMEFEFILVNPNYDKHIALIQLNRPKELNALNLQLMLELKSAFHQLDDNEEVRCIIITGNDQVHPLICRCF